MSCFDSRLLAAHSGPRADVSAVLASMQLPHLCYESCVTLTNSLWFRLLQSFSACPDADILDMLSTQRCAVS